MPKGPKGDKRPADAVGAAVMVAKIATGEIKDEVTDDGKNKAAVELGRKGGPKPGLRGTGVIPRPVPAHLTPCRTYNPMQGSSNASPE